MSDRSPAFQFYPDKWESHTRHLSDVSYKIFHKIMCWMWLHSSNYFSMPMEEGKISKLIGETPARIRKAMTEIMDADMPLLRIEDNMYILNGLRKEATKQNRRRETAADAAKARWGQSKSNADAMRTHSDSIKMAMPETCPPSPTPSPSPTPTPDPQTKTPAADAAALSSRRPKEKKTPFRLTDASPEFQQFWDAMPWKSGPSEAWDNWQKILKEVNVTAADLIQAAKNYAEECEAAHKIEAFYKPSNFVGKKGYYQNYLPGVYRPNTPASPLAKKPCVLTQEDIDKMKGYM